MVIDWENLEDGIYLTYPTYGPPTATRELEIKNGLVVCGGYLFNQQFFFEVNTVVKRLK